MTGRHVLAVVVALGAAAATAAERAPYFGDLHVHTRLSTDAYAFGTRATPDDAYRYAKGEPIQHPAGHEIALRAPLDFCAVTDHAEYIGEMYTTQVKGAPGYDEPMTTELRGLETFEERERWYMDVFQKNQRSGKPGQMPFYAGPETAKSAWTDVIVKAAQDSYEPGRFTTIIAYE